VQIAAYASGISGLLYTVDDYILQQGDSHDYSRHKPRPSIFPKRLAKAFSYVSCARAFYRFRGAAQINSLGALASFPRKINAATPSTAPFKDARIVV
jgi:hypothetical protein